MWDQLHTHWKAYSVLIIGLIFFIFLYLQLWPDRWFIRYISVALGIFYASWGIATHTKTKRISKRVIWEYIVVAVVATAILWLITI